MHRKTYKFLLAATILSGLAVHASAAQNCAPGNGGITLPPGFCASVFADNLGHVRQMAVSADGTLFANSWSGEYYHGAGTPPGGFLLALKDTTGTGHEDSITRFGPSEDDGDHGGTGIAIFKNGLFAETNDRIVRYALVDGAVPAGEKPETIVSGLPLGGDHPMHPFIIDAQGALLVDVGSATNSCQRENRMTNSMGETPCTETDTRAGIWRFDANARTQKFSRVARYATGLRNGEGFAADAQGRIFVTQHGRDQLWENFPSLYRPEQGHDLPAEELVALRQGADYGWPECYFDGEQKKLVLAPEYGGDGGRKIGVCAEKQAPAAFFPAHWAPNDAKFYEGSLFPSAYRGGVFIAFHGSWNRAPAPQGGYNIVFQPMAAGRASGPFAVFADGFAGALKDPEGARFRPTGLAVAPDGALYLSDDQRGRIWRVIFSGAAAASVTGVQSAAGREGSKDALPPEGIHPDAGFLASLPVPPGASEADVARGARIFAGAEANATCTGCHGADAHGSRMGPNLADGRWDFADGSVASLAHIITVGVAHPKHHGGAMPPMGGAHLSPVQVRDLADYIWALNHAR